MPGSHHTRNFLQISIMGATLFETVLVRPYHVVRFSNGVNITTAIACIVVVLIDMIVSNSLLDSLTEFLSKIFPFVPDQDILVCSLSSDANQARLLSTPIPMHKINGHLTHVKPARRFCLLILPMLLYVMLIIAQRKVINEQETSIYEVNLTIPVEQQMKFYQCSNTTDICTSYIFKSENLIDTVTALIAWWTGLTYIISKLMRSLYKELMKMDLAKKRCMSLTSQFRLGRALSWISPLLFVPYIVSDIREGFGSTWYPLILCVLLACCAGSSAGADLLQPWELDEQSKQQRLVGLVAQEKQLNTARPVLILEQTFVHQSTPTLAPNRRSSKVTPSIDERR